MGRLAIQKCTLERREPAPNPCLSPLDFAGAGKRSTLLYLFSLLNWNQKEEWHCGWFGVWGFFPLIVLLYTFPIPVALHNLLLTSWEVWQICNEFFASWSYMAQLRRTSSLHPSITKTPFSTCHFLSHLICFCWKHPDVLTVSLGSLIPCLAALTQRHLPCCPSWLVLFLTFEHISAVTPQSGAFSHFFYNSNPFPAWISNETVNDSWLHLPQPTACLESSSVYSSPNIIKS